LSCWGSNDKGQLGTGFLMSTNTPTKIINSGVKKVFGGAGNICALIDNGSMKCWGSLIWAFYSSSAQDTLVPVEVASSGIEQIAFTSDSYCTLGQGKVDCRGGNYYGQLGNGSTSQYAGMESNSSNYSHPITAGAKSIVAMANGYCALVNDSVSCWGYNGQGQVGSGVAGNPVLTPTLAISSGVSSLSAGGNSTCAILQNGELKCWGYGPLGDGTKNASSSPKTIISSGVVSVQISNSGACALLANGDMKCWGDNSLGQISKSLAATVLSPTLVENGVSRFILLSSTTCAYKTNVRSCWGSNSKGQYGDGGPTAPKPIRSLADFNAMQIGRSYYLESDLDFGNAVMTKSSGDISLDGKGFKIYNIGAKCNGTNCQINSGRPYYISALSFYNSDIKNLKLSFNADVSLFPNNPTDHFFINMLDVSRCKLRNMEITSNTVGTLPDTTTTWRRLVLSGLNAGSSSNIQDVSIDSTVNVVAPAGYWVSLGEISSVWGSSLKNVSVNQSAHIHYLGGGGTLYSVAVGSLNQGSIDNLQLTQNMNVQIDGNSPLKDVYVYSTSYPYRSSLTNSTLIQSGNFTPNHLENLSAVNGLSSVFDKTGSVHTFTKTP
jgi:hypothetical protein